jgi:DnaJ-class molecular chaperone
MKVSIRQLGPGMIQQMQHVCPDCKGSGLCIQLECQFCKSLPTNPAVHGFSWKLSYFGLFIVELLCDCFHRRGY